MLQFALNVRRQQLNAHNTALRISRQNVFTARKLIGRCVLLYAPRDEPRSGYFGQATIIGVYPDLKNPAFIWLHLAGQEIFDRAVSLSELYDAGDINDAPFYAYARALRLISPGELSRLASFEIFPRERSMEFAEATTSDPQPAVEGKRRTWVSRIVRRSIVRFQMLEYYGPKCVFSGEFHPSLDGLRFAVQTGHLKPLWLGGPDVIQNVIPMSGTVNWLWDEGAFSLQNNGAPIISNQASDGTRALLAKCTRIKFPPDTRHWPKAEYLEAHRDEVFEKAPLRRIH